MHLRAHKIIDAHYAQIQDRRIDIPSLLRFAWRKIKTIILMEDSIKLLSSRLIQEVNTDFYRTLYSTFNLKNDFLDSSEALYISADLHKLPTIS